MTRARRSPVAAAAAAGDRTSAAALAYDPARDGAPKLVAAGKGEIAEKILKLAELNGVPVRTDPDLMALLNAIDVGDEIPVEAFAAVAEILAYLYRVNALAGRDSSPTPEDRS